MRVAGGTRRLAGSGRAAAVHRPAACSAAGPWACSAALFSSRPHKRLTSQPLASGPPRIHCEPHPDADGKRGKHSGAVQRGPCSLYAARLANRSTPSLCQPAVPSSRRCAECALPSRPAPAPHCLQAFYTLMEVGRQAGVVCASVHGAGAAHRLGGSPRCWGGGRGTRCSRARRSCRVTTVLCCAVQGVGTPHDIDTGMRLGTNVPMGPLTLAGGCAALRQDCGAGGGHLYSSNGMEWNAPAGSKALLEGGVRTACGACCPGLPSSLPTLPCSPPAALALPPDFIGLDTCLAIMRVLHQNLGDDKYRCVCLRAHSTSATAPAAYSRQPPCRFPTRGPASCRAPPPAGTRCSLCIARCGL